MTQDVLRESADGGLMFRCPGCHTIHKVQVGDGAGPRWGWNGSMSLPTFTPSILVKSGHYASHNEGKEGCWCTYNKEHPEDAGDPDFSCYLCHSYIVLGQIRYLPDCTHELAGQNLDLQPFIY